jgi:glyoxylase-like metal-dependent hydrolase (beta-lactamase superfamily II)
MPEITLDVFEITSWLWGLRTPLVQAYAVRDGDGFNLIDTGIAGGEDAILSSLSSINGQPEGEVVVNDILLTHGHDDHTGAAAALRDRTGARVLAPAIDAPIIQGERPAPAPQLADWEIPLFEQITPLVPPAPPVRVDVRLHEGDPLPWNQQAKVLAAPGHTPGSIAVLFTKARVLVAGDAIASHESEPTLGVFNSDPAQAIASFRNLAALDVEIACFGHGAPVLGDARTQLEQVAARL